MEFQDRRVNIQHFYDVTKLWFKYFGTVSKFTVVWKDSKPWKQGDFRLAPDPPEALKGAIRVANKWLKTEAILVKAKLQERKEVSSKGFLPGILRRPDVVLGPELETFTWIWSVKRDSALVWNAS
jgi:hypothetical protein